MSAVVIDVVNCCGCLDLCFLPCLLMFSLFLQIGKYNSVLLSFVPTLIVTRKQEKGGQQQQQSNCDTLCQHIFLLTSADELSEPFNNRAHFYKATGQTLVFRCFPSFVSVCNFRRWIYCHRREFRIVVISRSHFLCAVCFFAISQVPLDSVLSTFWGPPCSIFSFTQKSTSPWVTFYWNVSIKEER